MPLPMSQPQHRDFTLEPADNERLANLCGPFDAHLRQIELRLGVEISNRGQVFQVTGPAKAGFAACTRKPPTPCSTIRPSICA